MDTLIELLAGYGWSNDEPGENGWRETPAETELDAVAARLHAEAEVPKAASLAGDFLDIAQSVQNQELAGVNAQRLSERARRLRIALSRVSDDEYGICVECGDSIPSKRLVAVADATTCLACQQRLERTRLADCR